MTDEELTARFLKLRERHSLAFALRAITRLDQRITAAEVAPAANRLIDEVCARLVVERGLVIAHGSGRRYWRARALCWWLLHRQLQMGPTEISAMFDNRNPSTVTKVLDRFRDHMAADEFLRRMVESFDEAALPRPRLRVVA